MPPKILAKNADRQGGVLPVNAATRAAGGKTPTARLKLEVRRLPPGLTLTEFEETLGEEWKLGNGKVDWREYRQGKTRNPGSGKVPEQSRCYVHVSSEAFVKEFEKRFLEVVFHDKAGTYKNPDLKHLAPTLAFAPSQRTPLQHAKQRTDNRQGTIDQDPEFIAFLEAETQPIVKATSIDVLHQERETGKVAVKTTPLIEDLREKKANRAKAAQLKAEKIEKDKKDKKALGKETVVATEKDAGKTIRQQKLDQAVKDASKAAMKQASVKQTQIAKGAALGKAKKPAQSPKPDNAVPAQSAGSPGPSSPAPQRAPTGPRQRGNADGIKKMLQKDLGIKPKATPPASTTSSIAPTPTVASAAANPKTILPSKDSAAASPKAPIPKNKPVITQSTDAKPPTHKAYLKHANPSQGMTEMLIMQALGQYGDVVNVTIDPRKGTAIAMFKNDEGLKKALEAKRIAVANGAVEVLEFRDRTAGGQTNRGGFRGRGGRGGARGGAQAQTAAAQSPSSAPAT